MEETQAAIGSDLIENRDAVGDKVTFGSMTVEITNGPSITGPGNLNEDNGGRIWFDYTGKDYPSSIDWKKATNLTFTPGMGKVRNFTKPPAQYFFNAGWVAPRLVLQS